MFNLIFIFISSGLVAFILTVTFFSIFIKSVYKKFTSIMHAYGYMQRDLLLLKDRIEKLVDELDKKSLNKNLNNHEDEREERWNRIRKAFDKKEKEKDGSS